MKRRTLTFPLIIAVIFPILFYKQQAGLNVLLFDILLLALVFYSGRLNFKNPLMAVVSAGIGLSGIMVLLNGSAIALTVNIVSIILISGLLAAPGITVLMNGFFSSFLSAFVAPMEYMNCLSRASGTNNSIRKGFRYAVFVIIPILTLLVFISIYSAASPYFNRLTGNFMRSLGNLFDGFFRIISPDVLAIGLGGFLIGLIVLYGRMPSIFDLPGENGDKELHRTKKWHNGSLIALKTEARMAQLLFILLNLALAVMNILDLWYVWINFEWDGGFLKQFVHEGTWLLILSIIISVILVLWYFRGNLNFYPKNKSLMLLAQVWIAQNLFLAISVTIRNFWYLHYFNLAYKRIWVYAFLIVVIVGLITVLIKVNNRKTLKYLLMRNSVYVYIVFAVLCLFNWDVIIAKFNVNRAEKAFYHTDFMVHLNNSALPVIIMDEQKLNRVSEAQAKMFTYHENYMSFEDYKTDLKWRKEHFLKEYPETHWLSWNLADWIAYRRLKAKG